MTGPGGELAPRLPYWQMTLIVLGAPFLVMALAVLIPFWFLICCFSAIFKQPTDWWNGRR